MADVALPIDPLLPEIVTTLRGSRSLVLEAPPGAGKTTRVPRALLQAGLAQGKEIVVLQPPRLPPPPPAPRGGGGAGPKARRLARDVGCRAHPRLSGWLPPPALRRPTLRCEPGVPARPGRAT